MRRSLMTSAMAMAALALSGAALAACSSPAPTASPSSTTPAATATTPVTTSTPAAPATTVPSASTAPSASAVLIAPWCSAAVTPVPAQSLTAWLQGMGFTEIENVEATLTALKDTNVAATIQQLGASLCGDVSLSEEAPPPADLPDYTTAMNDFLKGSQLLHANPEPSGVQAASADISAGTAAYDNFREGIGRPI